MDSAEHHMSTSSEFTPPAGVGDVQLRTVLRRRESSVVDDDATEQPVKTSWHDYLRRPQHTPTSPTVSPPVARRTKAAPVDNSGHKATVTLPRTSIRTDQHKFPKSAPHFDSFVERPNVSTRTQTPTPRGRINSEGYFGDHSILGRERAHSGVSAPGVEIRGYSIKQSERLPYWIWFIVAKSLGIKLHEDDKPWFGTLLFVLSLLMALTSVCSTLWYMVYDVINEKTNITALSGTTFALLALYWCSMCIYANELAYKLLTNKKMLMSVRMHSKTLFKINTVFLMSFLGLTFIVLNNYGNYGEFSDSRCLSLSLPTIICKLKYLSRVGLSIFGLLWNLLVGTVVLSVCRTHTIGIRRFSRELESDGMVYVQNCRDKTQGHGRFDDIMHNFETEELPSEEEQEDVLLTWSSPSRRSSHFYTPRASIISDIRHDSHDASATSECRHLHKLRPLSNRIIEMDETTPTASMEAFNVQTATAPSEQATDEPGTTDKPKSEDPNHTEQKGSGDHSDIHDDDAVDLSPDFALEHDVTPALFTTEDILLSYHQITVRLRTTSRSLQRWMSSWIALITFWSFLYVIHWINHAATFIGIAEFVIPLLLLPLVCSAYAEVNFEGKRLLKCICPLEDRLKMLCFMQVQPLQMTVYDQPVSFSAILTVIGAVGLAFLTRIMLSELKIG